MRLQIRGVPRNYSQVFSIEPAQSGALLGRTDGENNNLVVPIPHIEQSSPGEPATTCWSRSHLRFDFQGGGWYVTLVGKEKTLLDEHVLLANVPTRLPPEGSLRCGEVTLRATTSSGDDDRFKTRTLEARPAPVHNPFDTVAIRQDVRQPVVAPAMERISVDSLASQARTMVEQMRSELDRLTNTARDMQQRRSQAEQCREEARVALVGVRQATTPQQLQAATERVRDASQRGRKAADQAATAAEMLRRGVDRTRDLDRSLRSLSEDTARAVARLPPGEPTGRILTGQISQAQEDAQRRMAEIEDLSQRAEREREQVQSAERTTKEVEEEAQTLASRREEEFRRKVRMVAILKRYAVIGLILVAMILFGLFLGKLMESCEPPPPVDGQSLRGVEAQQRLQFVQVIDHSLQITVDLDVHRGIRQQLGSKSEPLDRVDQLALAALPIDARARL